MGDLLSIDKLSTKNSWFMLLKTPSGTMNFHVSSDSDGWLKTSIKSLLEMLLLVAYKKATAHKKDCQIQWYNSSFRAFACSTKLSQQSSLLVSDSMIVQIGCPFLILSPGYGSSISQIHFVGLPCQILQDMLPSQLWSCYYLPTLSIWVEWEFAPYTCSCMSIACQCFRSPEYYDDQDNACQDDRGDHWIVG